MLSGGAGSGEEIILYTIKAKEMKKIISSDPWVREEMRTRPVMEYLKKWLLAFEKELIKYQERNPKDCPWWYGERTTLGFFLNAILQEEKQKINFLQEFDSIRKKEKTRGRGDLLLWNQEICLLFESKKYYTIYKMDGSYYDKKEGENEFWFVRDVLEQAGTYDINAYNKTLGIGLDQTFKIALCFDSLLYPKLNTKEKNDSFEDIYLQWKNDSLEKEEDIDFYKFYHYSRDYEFDCMVEKKGNIERSYLGMALYGKIENYKSS